MENYNLNVIEELRQDINNDIREIYDKIDKLFVCFHIALGFILIQFGIVALLLFIRAGIW